MREVKALFIDCDGVLYDKDHLTYEDMAIVGLGKTLDVFGISQDCFDEERAKLREKNIHGLFNVVLELSQKNDFSFLDFASQMVENTDYSRIPQDLGMLDLLRKLGDKMLVYCVTNNTYPHLLRVLRRLNGDKMVKMSDVNIIPMTVEKTLSANRFHPKNEENQLANLCSQVGLIPCEVLLLDDTQAICDAAKQQGLHVVHIEGAEHTKKIIRNVVDDKSQKRVSFVTVRQTSMEF